MTQSKKIPPKPSGRSGGKGRSKKQKQPTQRPQQQRVMIMGANGKIRFEWRPW